MNSLENDGTREAAQRIATPTAVQSSFTIAGFQKGFDGRYGKDWYNDSGSPTARTEDRNDLPEHHHYYFNG